MTTTHLAADAPGSAPAWQRGISLATCLAMVPTMASPSLTLVGLDPFLSVMLGLGTTLLTLVIGGTVLAKRLRTDTRVDVHTPHEHGAAARAAGTVRGSADVPLTMAARVQ